MPRPPRALATRILLLALAGGVAVDVLVPGNAPGVNAPILVASLLGAAFAVAGRAGLRRLDPADAWMPPAALALAGLAAVRADPWLVEADLLVAAALVAGTIGGLSGRRITRGLVPEVLAVAATVIAAACIGAAEVVAAARPRREDGEAAAGPRRRRVPTAVVPVLRGLAIALPLLLVFGVLFASADAVFARIARGLLELRLDLDVADAADRVAIVTVVAWAVAGLLALAAAALPALGRDPGPPGVVPGARSLGAASASASLAGPRLGSIEATTVLVALDALFAGFVALQLAYLFGGRDTLAAAGLTYADYARRGFFELVAVAMLAGTLAAALDLAVVRRSRGQLAAALALVALTAVVLASALLRLRLYQDAYGWTELRFVVLTGILWLAVTLAATAALLVARRTRWILHVLGVVSIVTIAAMNVVGPQATVAQRNLERALDPTLVPAGGRTGVDATYLASLGDEAIPAIVAAWPGLPAADRESLVPFLAGRAAALRSDPGLTGWPSWNAARERAREALRRWEARASAVSTVIRRAS